MKMHSSQLFHRFSVKRPRPDYKPRPQTVLIIDDDQDQAESLSLRLMDQGFETVTAHSGHVGLAAARRESPDLILLDVRLPDIDGFFVCQRLSDDVGACEIPVIMLSGMEAPDIIRRCRAAGCYYFVRKPYDPNVLLTLIEQAIRETQG